MSSNQKPILEKALRNLCSIPNFDVPKDIPTIKNDPKWKKLKETCDKEEIKVLKRQFCGDKEEILTAFEIVSLVNVELKKALARSSFLDFSEGNVSYDNLIETLKSCKFDDVNLMSFTKELYCGEYKDRCSGAYMKKADNNSKTATSAEGLNMSSFDLRKNGLHAKNKISMRHVKLNRSKELEIVKKLFSTENDYNTFITEMGEHLNLFRKAFCYYVGALEGVKKIKKKVSEIQQFHPFFLIFIKECISRIFKNDTRQVSYANSNDKLKLKLIDENNKKIEVNGITDVELLFRISLREIFKVLASYELKSPFQDLYRTSAWECINQTTLQSESYGRENEQQNRIFTTVCTDLFVINLNMRYLDNNNNDNTNNGYSYHYTTSRAFEAKDFLDKMLLSFCILKISDLRSLISSDFEIKVDNDECSSIESNEDNNNNHNIKDKRTKRKREISTNSNNKNNNKKKQKQDENSNYNNKKKTNKTLNSKKEEIKIYSMGCYGDDKYKNEIEDRATVANWFKELNGEFPLTESNLLKNNELFFLQKQNDYLSYI